MSAPAIRSRKPTGRVPWPLILIEGEEKAGKSWAALLLSASKKVGATYVLDLGEGGSDEYGAIPGADFEILIHDGTWAQIIDQVQAVKAAAGRAKDAGQPPVVLVIDSITDVWNGLKDWVSARYRRSPAGRRAIEKDPDAELKPTQNLWNDANSRHRRLMTALMTFPGIVVLTARGKEVTEVRDGKPVEGSKVWSVDAQRDVPFDATVWLRMRRSQPPTVIGARSVFVGVRPGVDDPKPVTAAVDNLLEWLVFDALRCDPATAQPRDLVHTAGGDPTPEERGISPEVESWMGAWTDQVSEARDKAALAKLWKELAAKQKVGFVDEGLAGDLAAHWKGRSEAVQRAEAARDAGAVSAA